MRAKRAKLGVIGALVLVGGGIAAVLAATAGGAEGGPELSQPKALLNVVEGDGGVSTVSVPVTLSPAAAAPVTVGYETLDDSATVAGGDYVPATGTLTFAPGETTKSITVLVWGDTALEDFEHFHVRLGNVAGAELGQTVRKVQIRNDETPLLVLNPAKAKEGSVAVFKARLRQRHDTALKIDAVTRDGTARAPGDYTPKSTSVAFAAGTRGPVPVNVATKGDAVVEPAETFNLFGFGDGLLATALATVTDGPKVVPTSTTSPTTTSTTTGGQATCSVGSIPNPTQPDSPPSPSSRGTLLPPASVLGNAQWDLVFNDEFQDPAYTASKWSTGMRTGDKTLEGNQELQWYVPENSVHTSDSDGVDTLGVLRQTVEQKPVANTAYTVRTLSRLYPPSRCPSHYTAGGNTSTSASNRNPTRTPFQFTSGMLNNARSFGFKYGYVETRVKMPKGFALWPALWLRDWGGWGYEIDVFEVFDRQSRTFRTSYWWGNGNTRSTENDGGDIGQTVGGEPCEQHLPIPASASRDSECTLDRGVDLSKGYHTIGLWWTADKYELYFDGVKRWTSPAGADVADTYNHLIMNLALGNNEYEFDWTKQGVLPFQPNVFKSSLFPKRTIEWDYVRVWQPHAALDLCTPPNCG